MNTRPIIIACICTLIFFSCGNEEKKHEEPNVKVDTTRSIAAQQKVPATMLKTSTITCPKCGFKKMEVMPTDKCQLSYACKQCGNEMHPQNGDCCVFCTYGDKKCPSMQ